MRQDMDYGAQMLDKILQDIENMSSREYRELYERAKNLPPIDLININIKTNINILESQFTGSVDLYDSITEISDPNFKYDCDKCSDFSTSGSSLLLAA